MLAGTGKIDFKSIWTSSFKEYFNSLEIFKPIYNNMDLYANMYWDLMN